MMFGLAFWGLGAALGSLLTASNRFVSIPARHLPRSLLAGFVEARTRLGFIGCTFDTLYICRDASKEPSVTRLLVTGPLVTVVTH